MTALIIWIIGYGFTCGYRSGAVKGFDALFRICMILVWPIYLGEEVYRLITKNRDKGGDK